MVSEFGVIFIVEKMEDDFTILIAEDNLGHFVLTKKCLEKAHFSEDIVHLSDGQIAYDYLQCHCSNCDHEKYLLLLDIRMPKIDGIEILKRMKEDANMKDIPVVVVSTSDNPAHMKQCKELGCNDYIVKPLDGSFSDTITDIVHSAFAEAL